MIWYLAGLMVLIYLINKFTLYFGFSNLNYRMEMEKRTAEIGEDIEVFSIIENKKLLTISFLKIHERFPRAFNVTENIYSLFIMPYQRVKRTYKVSASKRGVYSIENSVLELGDFVGIKSERRVVAIEKELIVFPQKIELEDNIVPVGSLNGDTSVKRWIIDDPLMTIGIREYTGNEPERFIHWPSSLKYGNLMVKNFDFTADNNVLVLLNVETMKPCWKPVEEELIEKVISLARSVMEEFEYSKIPYGFTSNESNNRVDQGKNYFYHPGLGHSHFYNLLETLSKINYKLPSFFENTLRDVSKRKGNYTTVVIITPKILHSYVDWINLLSRSVNKTIVISVEEENLSSLNNNIIKYRSR